LTDPTGDEAGVVGAQEGGGGGDVFGCSAAAHGDHGRQNVERRDGSGLDPGLGHGGVDDVRRDGVDGDALRGQFVGEGFGQRDHSALGCDVVGALGRTGLGAGRGDRDDAAPTRGLHVGDGSLDAGEGSGEVDGDQPVPLLGGDLGGGHRCAYVDAGAGDHDADRSEVGAYVV